MRSDTVVGEEEVDDVIFLLPNLTLRNAVDQITVCTFRGFAFRFVGFFGFFIIISRV